MKPNPITLTALLLAGLTLAAPLTAAPRRAPAKVTVVPATRDLSHFRRDDAAPGGVTRIYLDATRVAVSPLSPDVFGNFVENLGSVIYDTLWANALHNPQIERTDPKQSVAPWWDQTGAATWQEADGSGYLSKSCERLAAPGGTLSQRVFLPASRTRRYTLTLWMRAPTGAGGITAALRTGGEPDGPFQPGLEAAGQALLTSTLVATDESWRKQTLRWELPAGMLPKGQASRLVLAYKNGQPVEVDDVELFPDDAVEGFDPDTLRVARAWQMPLLRWSGNFSSGYNWRDGVGPRAARPTLRNVAWGSVEPNTFGTDEYLTLTRLLGTARQIGANAGDGTPDMAAAWVRYCNDPKFPSRRVPLWEIGNELYGGWQIGHTDAAGNAARFVRFRRSMLAADPTIEVMATGQGDEFTPEGLAREKVWNDSVMQAAVAGGGASPAFLTIHPLVPLPDNLADRPYAERYESAMAHPAFMDDTEIPALIQSIKDAEGPNAKTRLASTEWGIIVGGKGWEDGPNHNVTAGAIYNALTLNTYLRNGDWMTLANMTALLHGGGIKKDRGVVYVDPLYYTQQLYTVARPAKPIGTDWAGPGHDVPGRGFLPAVSNVSDVDVFSALTADSSKVVAFLVNRQQSEARPVHLTVAGFTAARRSATVLTSTDPQASNGWDHPDTVKPLPFALPAPDKGGSLDFTLPPHSLVVVTLTRN